MPKFIVGVIATADVEVEADTEGEAEALAIAEIVLLNSADWSVDYCEKLDGDDDEGDEDDKEDDEDIDDEDIENFKFANEA